MFTYEAGKTTLNHQDNSFVPIYLDEVNATVRSNAEATCGSTDFTCVFDFIATQDSDFAMYSASVYTEAQTIQTSQCKLLFNFDTHRFMMKICFLDYDIEVYC